MPIQSPSNSGSAPKDLEVDRGSEALAAVDSCARETIQMGLEQIDQVGAFQEFAKKNTARIRKYGLSEKDIATAVELLAPEKTQQALSAKLKGPSGMTVIDLNAPLSSLYEGQATPEQIESLRKVEAATRDAAQ